MNKKDIPKIEVDININNEEFTRNVNDDLYIDINNLDESLCIQASLYAYYTSLLQRINALRDNSEFKLDKITNEMIVISKSEIGQKSDSKTKWTDKQITAFVESRSEVIKAKEEYVNYCCQSNKLYSLVRALEQKKDTLVALAYSKRAEMEMMKHSSIYKYNKKIDEIPKSGIEDEN